MTRLSQLLRRWSAGGDDIIRTPRLVLRPLVAAELPEVARLASDWDVAAMTARIPYPYTLNDAQQWFEGLEEGETVQTVTSIHDGRLLGLTGYHPTADRRSAEIGYWIGKSYWGNGYATEAAKALVAFCFDRAGFKELTCCHFADNPASARVIAKLGFTQTGSCDCWSEARRMEAPAHQYELARQTWRERTRLGI